MGRRSEIGDRHILFFSLQSSRRLSGNLESLHNPLLLRCVPKIDVSCRSRAGRNLDAMILGVGNDVQDALVRQTIGIQPYLSLPRINDVPVQWVQLLNGFDQQDLYGWPLPTPLKVQMQKCDKCSREFCSTINYRRHIRVHRRSNVDKESHKNRDSLGAFWDKVSLDEAKKILSFEDVILEGVPGSSIIKALASFVRAPGFCALPQVYVKAGYVLLDVIEASPSRLPISSQEFFTVLDDASESTFLCGGSAGSLQKFIFDGEAGKVGLEMKNLVACTSFLLEQNLVKAWIADKDAEALRCQKLLVEEEEAAQKRQAELLERKRLRKLRQKEQRTKGRSYKETSKLTGGAEILENVPVENVPDAESSRLHQSAGGYTSELLDVGRAKNVELPESEGNNNQQLVDTKSQVLEPMSEGIGIEGKDNRKAKNVELPESEGNNNPHIVDSKVQILESMGEQLHPSHNLDVVKPDPMQKNFPPAQVNSSEIQTDRTSCEVMIGSISVTVGNCIAQKRHDDRSSRVDHVTCGSVGAQDKHIVDNDNKQNDFIPPSKLALSSHSARAFLSQRWKEAISGDHETLVLSQEPEHQGHRDVSAENCLEAFKPSRKPKKGYLIKVQS
ncbi:Serine/arginine repetitive matrix protein [Heracleum sosnowskyi]|uniref:Serine/arginine repetitive matrix protein n=1 Tax=Heracleum sosnowskyi TaxID=360622 RepID=A0AAD8JAI6_9APIA|nr:Serine/arginine repetitive matrix protein [Heracleum sosnowskyi]